MKAFRLILAASWAITLCRCGTPLRPDFDSVDPRERTAALAQAIKAGEPQAVPKLISMLGSVDPAERMLAIRGLERITGRDFGYRYYEPPSQRQQAIERWTAWWKRTGPEGLAGKKTNETAEESAESSREPRGAAVGIDAGRAGASARGGPP